MIPTTFNDLKEWSKGRKLPWTGPVLIDGEEHFVTVDKGYCKPLKEFFLVTCYWEDDFVTVTTYYSNGMTTQDTRKWTP